MEWWTQQNAGLIGALLGGVLGGGFGGIGGGVGGTLASLGKARALVLGIFYVGIGIGVVLLGGAVVALVMGQPYHVWFVLLLPGGLMTVLFSALTPVIKTRYRQAEQRKLAAEELRRG